MSEKIGRARALRQWPGRIRRRITAEHRSDPLPRGWIWIALILSIVAAWSGWRLAGKDLAVNVLGNLVLLGPGLVLTNVVARTWKGRRERESVREAVRDLCEGIYRDLVMPVETYYACLFEPFTRPEQEVTNHKVQSASIKKKPMDDDELAALIQDFTDVPGELLRLRSRLQRDAYWGLSGLHLLDRDPYDGPPPELRPDWREQLFLHRPALILMTELTRIIRTRLIALRKEISLYATDLALQDLETAAQQLEVPNWVVDHWQRRPLPAYAGIGPSAPHDTKIMIIQHSFEHLAEIVDAIRCDIEAA